MRYGHTINTAYNSTNRNVFYYFSTLHHIGHLAEPSGAGVGWLNIAYLFNLYIYLFLFCFAAFSPTFQDHTVLQMSWHANSAHVLVHKAENVAERAKEICWCPSD